MKQKDETQEEFSFRIGDSELKSKKPGKNTIVIVVIICLFILCLTALVKFT